MGNHVVGHNYPSVNDILDNYADVIRTLEITKPKLTKLVKPDRKKKISTSGRSQSAGISWNPSKLETFFVKLAPVQYRGNFCRNSLCCRKYPSLEVCLR